MIANFDELKAAVEELYRPITTAEVLEKMLEALEAGWIKGTLSDGYGVCLLGALNKACTGDGRNQPVTSDKRAVDAYNRALAALKHAMDQLQLGPAHLGLYDRIPAFNDAVDTTYEDVRLVVKHALANEETEENCE